MSLEHVFTIRNAADVRALHQEMDVITLHRFAMGDRVVKCAHCHLVFCEDSVATGTDAPMCPSCRDTLVPEIIRPAKGPPERVRITHRRNPNHARVFGVNSMANAGAQRPRMVIRHAARRRRQLLGRVLRGFQGLLTWMSVALVVYAGIQLAQHDVAQGMQSLGRILQYAGERAAVVLQPFVQGAENIWQSMCAIGERMSAML